MIWEMKKHLKDVLNFEKDVKPYKIVQINAGVGAGKSSWIESIENQRVLLITSRAITANVQAERFGAGRWITRDDMRVMHFYSGKGLTYKYIVTNAVIERYAKEIYDVRDKGTYLWDCFDLIILDEAHSLITDASFSDAPFHVYDFMYQAEYRGMCHLIFMTGTPEPIENIFTPKTVNGGEYKKYDFFNECISVVPRKVTLFPYCKIARKLFEELTGGKRIIYFANTISGIKEIYGQLIAFGIAESAIGVTFAPGNSSSKNEFKEMHKESAGYLQEYIRKNEAIPQEIQILLTTSVNREGININDDDIDEMFAESSEKTELIQMAGRVRKGVQELFVLYGVPKNYKQRWVAFEQDINSKCVENVNTVAEFYFERYFDGTRNDERLISDVVSEVEQQFPYIRYSYFEHEFCFYGAKAQEEKSQSCDEELIKNYVETWDAVDEFQRLFCEEDDLRTGRELFQQWFPMSEVELVEIKTEKSELLVEVGQLLCSKGLLNVEVSRKQLDKAKEKIRKMLAEYDCGQLKINPSLQQNASFFRQFGYCLREAPGRRKGTAYILTKKDSAKQT